MFLSGKVTPKRVEGWVDISAPPATVVVEMEPGYLNGSPAQAVLGGGRTA